MYASMYMLRTHMKLHVVGQNISVKMNSIKCIT